MAQWASGQETFLASTDDCRLSKLDKQDTKEVTDELYQDKVGKYFKNYCFTEESVIYSRPVVWRWIPQHFRGTLGDCPGSQMSLSVSISLKAGCFVLHVYSGNIISFLGLWWCWRLDSYVTVFFATKLKNETHKRDVK